MKIRAAVARATHSPLSLEHLEMDEPRSDEILVRVVATGVCHTDIAMRDQVFPVPQPVVLGHEGAGIVERVGSAITKVAPGDHVVMSYNFCGHCHNCLDHNAFYCYDLFSLNFGAMRPDGTSPIHALDGGHVHGNFFGQSSFANYAICNERNVVKVDPAANLEALGPLGCGVQTGAGAVINALKVGIGDTIAVFGAGAVGLSAVMAARLIGASTIIAVDRNPERLDLARELGATHAVNVDRENVVEAAMRITGVGVNYSFEATGIPKVVSDALAVLSTKGVCGMVGSFPRDATIPITLSHLMSGGRTLRGIIEGESNSDIFIPHLIELNRQGRFPYDRMISYYDFDNINKAIEDSEKGTTIKPVIRMR